MFDYTETPSEKLTLGVAVTAQDGVGGLRGEIWAQVQDEHGVVLETRHHKNLIVLDAGVLIMRLLVNPAEPAHGLNMMAVGTGAPGNPNAPDAPTTSQRSLVSEIARKNVTMVFRHPTSGAASSVPTNVVDFTAVFGSGEAAGALNEMCLVSTISGVESSANAVPVPNVTPRDPTVDLTQYDNMFNILNFPVLNKPATGTLTLTWRITA